MNEAQSVGGHSKNTGLSQWYINLIIFDQIVHLISLRWIAAAWQSLAVTRYNNIHVKGVISKKR